MQSIELFCSMDVKFKVNSVVCRESNFVSFQRKMRIVYYFLNRIVSRDKGTGLVLNAERENIEEENVEEKTGKCRKGK
jgi:hypothetical protein